MKTVVTLRKALMPVMKTCINIIKTLMTLMGLMKTLMTLVILMKKPRSLLQY